MHAEPRPESAPSPEAGKRVYQRPVLRDYGDIRALTLASPGQTIFDADYNLS